MLGPRKQKARIGGLQAGTWASLDAHVEMYGARGRLEPSATGCVIDGFSCYVVFNLLTNLLTFLFVALPAGRFLGDDSVDPYPELLHGRDGICHGLFFDACELFDALGKGRAVHALGAAYVLGRVIEWPGIAA